MHQPKLKEILDRYKILPEFLGLELTDPNQRGAVDNSPLHIAASIGNIEDIELLIEYGADVNLAGDLGFTPLHFAALKGQERAADKLLSLGANSNAKNEFMQTPSEVAALGEHQNVVNIIQRARR